MDFKTQTLDALLVELDVLQGRVMAQEYQCDEAHRKVEEYNLEYTRRKVEGMTILEAMECESCQQVLQRRAKQEDEKLVRLKKLEDATRNEVVEARKETHSLEKLKEMRRTEYDKAVVKEEEKFLDDLAAARRVTEAAG